LAVCGNGPSEEIWAEEREKRKANDLQVWAGLERKRGGEGKV
jgi:hypothetical protein